MELSPQYVAQSKIVRNSVEIGAGKNIVRMSLCQSLQKSRGIIGQTRS